MSSSNFHGGNFSKDKLYGLYTGTVVDREDPELLGRITVEIPGLIDTESNWAFPRTGGSKNWGSVNIPPVGSDVYVQFIMGDIDQPVWEPGPFGLEENFPEHEGADVSVFGSGPFRLVIDNREGVQTATFKIVKTVNGAEDSICELVFNADTNSVRMYATSALQIESGGIVDIDSTGAVQIKQRKTMPVNRPIN